MSNKNEIFLATRVNELLMKQIDDYCTDYKITKSELLRKAILYFLKYSQQDDNTYHPMIIFSKQELSFMIECLKEDELKEYAKLSFDMGEMSTEHFTETHGTGQAIDLRPRFFMRTMKNEVFSHYGQNWFQDLEYAFKSDKLQIAGKHNLNLNFSIFFKYLMEFYLQKHKYKLSRETLKDSKVILLFSKD